MCSGENNATMTVKADPRIYGTGEQGDENARKAYGVTGWKMPAPPSLEQEKGKPKQQDLADLLAQQDAARKLLEARQGRGLKASFLSDYVKENTTLTSMPTNSDTLLGG